MVARKGHRKKRRLAPPVVLIGLYIALIVAGTILLKLPMALHVHISWSDAAFTATSAVTVTGLSVVDTASTYTLFGEIVVLVLIQLGGLGLMTIAVLILMLLGLPIGMTHHIYLREDLNQGTGAQVLELVKTIFFYVLMVELAGAALLSFAFVPELGLWRGLWFGIFHAVSAFNNAGFSLYHDSMTGWAGNPVINIVIPLLVIGGGLGFTVIADLWETRSWRRLALHTKLMLVGTAALLGLSVFGFALMEWGNEHTLGTLPNTAQKLEASWFQAVMARTAGFNSLDLSQLNDSTTLMLMVLMFIGAGSTSTGGGIKVTTFLVLILTTVAFFRRSSAIHVFNRQLETEQIIKVLALTMVSVLAVVLSLFVLVLFHEGDFLDLAFESVSAFATVGTTRGVTGELDGAGRIVIMLIMFIGRVGPLSVGFLLYSGRAARLSYPKGNVILG